MDHFDFFKKHIIYVFIFIQKEYSALHEAIRNGHIGLSKYLIHEGADVNMKAKVKLDRKRSFVYDFVVPFEEKLEYTFFHLWVCLKGSGCKYIVTTWILNQNKTHIFCQEISQINKINQ